VTRLPEVAREEGVFFRWRPFCVRAIKIEMDNIPFVTKPTKAAYMWRDIERRSARYGVPVRVPAPHPLKAFDLANCVAVLGAREGWCSDYVRATYRRWSQDGERAGSEPNLSASLKESGQDPSRVPDLAASGEIGRAYEAATEEARRIGVFGAPSFVIGDEVFWGDDRLDDAIEWSRRPSGSGGRR
jgi:2-hydroxychromene-2-carboxylate isomerase